MLRIRGLESANCIFRIPLTIMSLNYIQKLCFNYEAHNTDVFMGDIIKGLNEVEVSGFKNQTLKSLFKLGIDVEFFHENISTILPTNSTAKTLQFHFLDLISRYLWAFKLYKSLAIKSRYQYLWRIGKTGTLLVPSTAYPLESRNLEKCKYCQRWRSIRDMGEAKVSKWMVCQSL